MRTSCKQVPCPFGHPLNRSQHFWFAATLTAEKRSHIRQDGVGHVEHDLKWPESEYGGGKTPREPFCVGQIPERLRDGFPSQFHRTIGHQDVDRFVGIPDVEVRIKRPKPLRIVTNRLYEDARLTGFALRRPLHPMPDMATDSAFIIKEEDRLSLLLGVPSIGHRS